MSTNVNEGISGPWAALAANFGTRRVSLFVVPLLVGLTCLLVSSSASALVIGTGWSGAGDRNASEMLEVAKSGSQVFRVPINNDWAGDDALVEAAALNGVTIHAGLGGGGPLPGAGAPTQEWLNWVSTAVTRYGYGGKFWEEHKSLPYKPITTWEVWNEPDLFNIPAANFGQFVSENANTIQSASNTTGKRGTEVLAGGLNVWGNLSAFQSDLTYMAGAYPKFATNANVTGVAIHPYELDPTTFYKPAGQPQYNRIEAFKYAVAGFHYKLVELAEAAKSSQKKLWITEAGWPAEGPQWSVGAAEQASLLKQSIDYAKNNQTTLNLGGYIWYNYRDRTTTATWDDYCGLRDHGGSYRPSWFAFQEETGAPKWPVPLVPGLYGIAMNHTGEKHTGVHFLGSATEYQTWGLQRETLLGETNPLEWQWAVGDTNKDGYADLVGVAMNHTGEKHTGVHVLSGATEYQTWLTQRETPLGETNTAEWQWTMGDVNKDGYPDLVGVAMNHTGEKHTGVHVLSGATEYQTWLTQRETPLGETNTAEWQWTMGDVNKDGYPDLVGVAMNHTGEKHTGVHVLSGATEYQTWLVQRETPLGETNPAEWQWTMGDVNKDGYADLVGVAMNHTGEKHTGVHVLSGATEYQTWLVQRETPLGETNASEWQFRESP